MQNQGLVKCEGCGKCIFRFTLDIPSFFADNNPQH